VHVLRRRLQRYYPVNQRGRRKVTSIRSHGNSTGNG
jgi:hypothetical protein